MVHNDVRGTIMCNSGLSGMPEVVVYLTDPSIVHDSSFHPCVRLRRFEQDRLLSFVPPDGNFKLMEYRAPDRGHTSPLSCRPTVSFRDGSGRVSFALGVRPMGGRRVTATGGTGSVSPAETAPVEDIALRVSFPSSVKSADLTSEYGKVLFDAATKRLMWTVGRFPREMTGLVLAGTVELEAGVTEPVEPVHAELQFTLPNQSASGLNIREVAIHGEDYQFFKGARSVLRAGRYQLRC